MTNKFVYTVDNINAEIEKSFKEILFWLMLSLVNNDFKSSVDVTEKSLSEVKKWLKIYSRSKDISLLNIKEVEAEIDNMYILNDNYFNSDYNWYFENVRIWMQKLIAIIYAQIKLNNINNKEM